MVSLQLPLFTSQTVVVQSLTNRGTIILVNNNMHFFLEQNTYIFGLSQRVILIWEVSNQPCHNTQTHMQYTDNIFLKQKGSAQPNAQSVLIYMGRNCHQCVSLTQTPACANINGEKHTPHHRHTRTLSLDPHSSDTQ